MFFRTQGVDSKCTCEQSEKLLKTIASSPARTVVHDRWSVDDRRSAVIDQRRANRDVDRLGCCPLAAGLFRACCCAGCVAAMARADKRAASLAALRHPCFAAIATLFRIGPKDRGGGDLVPRQAPNPRPPSSIYALPVFFIQKRPRARSPKFRSPI